MFVRTVVAGGLLAIWAAAAPAAPEAELWQRWAASSEQSSKSIEHGAWSDFLSTYVSADSDGINRVAYAKVAPADRKRLEGYLKRLQDVTITKLSRAEQRAYWINLYNAATVKLVLDHFPIDSITKINISPGLFARGPWGKKILKVEGEDVSLDDIEHRILRPIWKDPRLHYALNCASYGCPNLATKAYTAANTEQMLEEGATAYVNHPRGVAIEDGRVKVSSIYVWFQQDFGGGDEAVIEHLRHYAGPELKAKLADKRSISGHFYDWALNGSGGTVSVSRR